MAGHSPETERERFLRRAAEARAFVARVAPELLVAASEVDQTLLDWTLSLTPDDRLRSVEAMGRLWEAGLDASPSRGSAGTDQSVFVGEH